MIEGEAYFDQAREPFSHDTAGVNYFDMDPPCLCGNRCLVLYERGAPNILITTEKNSVRFLLVSGKPLNEPIAWYGPIVMNTHEELRMHLRNIKKVHL